MAGARSSSDCAQLLRFALLRAFWPVGALAVPHVRSRCVWPLGLGRPDSILLARGTVRAPFRSIFARFGGRAGVATKNARHAIRIGRSDRNRRLNVPRSTQNRSKIASGASRKRLCVKITRKLRFRTSVERPGTFRERLGAPGDPLSVSRERPGPAPGHAWSVPGASLSCPKSPKLDPRAPRVIFDRFGGDLWSISERSAIDWG